MNTLPRDQGRKEFLLNDNAQYTGNELLVPIPEAARRLGIGRTELYKYLDKPGGVPVIHFGRAARVAVADLVEFSQRLRREAAQRNNGE